MAPSRPDPGRTPPEGYKLVARPERDDWRTETEGCCRYGGGSVAGRRRCGKPPVLALLRGTTRPAWWRYCADHAYGRWVEDGQVMHWVTWPLDPCDAPGCLANAGHGSMHDILPAGDPVYARGLPQEPGSGDE